MNIADTIYSIYSFDAYSRIQDTNFRTYWSLIFRMNVATIFRMNVVVASRFELRSSIIQKKFNIPSHTNLHV